jgi:hypothetical protein
LGVKLGIVFSRVKEFICGYTLGVFEQLFVPACTKSKWAETLELPTGLLAYRFA